MADGVFVDDYWAGAQALPNTSPEASASALTRLSSRSNNDAYAEKIVSPPSSSRNSSLRIPRRTLGAQPPSMPPILEENSEIKAKHPVDGTSKGHVTHESKRGLVCWSKTKKSGNSGLSVRSDQLRRVELDSEKPGSGMTISFAFSRHEAPPSRVGPPNSPKPASSHPASRKNSQQSIGRALSSLPNMFKLRVAVVPVIYDIPPSMTRLASSPTKAESGVPEHYDVPPARVLPVGGNQPAVRAAYLLLPSDSTGPAVRIPMLYDVESRVARPVEQLADHEGEMSDHHEVAPADAVPTDSEGTLRIPANALHPDKGVIEALSVPYKVSSKVTRLVNAPSMAGSETPGHYDVLPAPALASRFRNLPDPYGVLKAMKREVGQPAPGIVNRNEQLNQFAF